MVKPEIDVAPAIGFPSYHPAVHARQIPWGKSNA